MFTAQQRNEEKNVTECMEAALQRCTKANQAAARDAAIEMPRYYCCGFSGLKAEEGKVTQLRMDIWDNEKKRYIQANLAIKRGTKFPEKPIQEMMQMPCVIPLRGELAEPAKFGKSFEPPAEISELFGGRRALIKPSFDGEKVSQYALLSASEEDYWGKINYRCGVYDGTSECSKTSDFTDFGFKMFVVRVYKEKQFDPVTLDLRVGETYFFTGLRKNGFLPSGVRVMSVGGYFSCVTRERAEEIFSSTEIDEKLLKTDAGATEVIVDITKSKEKVEYC